MVIFMHIDYNNGCTRVFRMCLMVIDMCIDKTFWQRHSIGTGVTVGGQSVADFSNALSSPGPLKSLEKPKTKPQENILKYYNCSY
jgi:hypothetical protein